MKIIRFLSDILNRLFKRDKKTTIDILLNDIVVGHIQTLKLIEDKYTHPRLEINRARFDELYLPTIFINGVFHKNSQKYPLKIEINDNGQLIHISNVWILSFDKYIKATGSIVVDCIEAEAEEIY